MMADYPDIQKVAEVELEEFISNPTKRGRSATPDLGDLIQYPFERNIVFFLLCVKLLRFRGLRPFFGLESRKPSIQQN